MNLFFGNLLLYLSWCLNWILCLWSLKGFKFIKIYFICWLCRYRIIYLRNMLCVCLNNRLYNWWLNNRLYNLWLNNRWYNWWLNNRLSNWLNWFLWLYWHGLNNFLLNRLYYLFRRLMNFFLFCNRLNWNYWNWWV